MQSRQSGQIQEIGFALYSDPPERAVQALKSGRTATLDQPLDHGAEIDLGLPALVPDGHLAAYTFGWFATNASPAPAQLVSWTTFR